MKSGITKRDVAVGGIGLVLGGLFKHLWDKKKNAGKEEKTGRKAS